MGVILSVLSGLVIWVVLWSLEVKAIDGIMIATVIALVAVMARVVSGHLLGNRRA